MGPDALSGLRTGPTPHPALFDRAGGVDVGRARAEAGVGQPLEVARNGRLGVRPIQNYQTLNRALSSGSREDRALWQGNSLPS